MGLAHSWNLYLYSWDLPTESPDSDELLQQQVRDIQGLWYDMRGMWAELYEQSVALTDAENAFEMRRTQLITSDLLLVGTLVGFLACVMRHAWHHPAPVVVDATPVDPEAAESAKL